jgi:hypothetical protein
MKNRFDIVELVRALLQELENPQRHLSIIANDFRECGIDYAVIGSFAVGVHNYVRAGEDIDILISKGTLPKIDQLLIGHGYSYRPGSTRHLRYEYIGGRVPLDIYVGGEERDGFILPDPRSARVQVCRIWYATLPLLLTLKVRSKEKGDVIELIQANELDEGFAAKLEPDAREKFLEMLLELKRSSA